MYARILSLGIQDTKRRLTNDHEHPSRRYRLTSHIRVAQLQDGAKTGWRRPGFLTAWNGVPRHKCTT